MNLVELIKKMPHSRRRMLSEAVGKSLLKEEDETLVVDGMTFVKTTAGWKNTYEASLEQVLSLIKDDRKDAVKKALQKTRNAEDYVIPRSDLIDDVSTPTGSLTFRKTSAGKFIDPTFLTLAQIGSIHTRADVEYEEGSVPEALNTTTPVRIGNTVITVDPKSESVVLSIPAGEGAKYFNDLFGKGSRAVDDLLKTSPASVSIPIKYASETSILRRLGDKGLLGLGTGEITFNRVGDVYQANVKLPSKQITVLSNDLKSLIGMGKASIPLSDMSVSMVGAQPPDDFDPNAISFGKSKVEDDFDFKVYTKDDAASLSFRGVEAPANFYCFIDKKFITALVKSANTFKSFSEQNVDDIKSMLNDTGKAKFDDPSTITVTLNKSDFNVDQKASVVFDSRGRVVYLRSTTDPNVWKDSTMYDVNKADELEKSFKDLLKNDLNCVIVVEKSADQPKPDEAAKQLKENRLRFNLRQTIRTILSEIRK